jgi:hypothetical protein
LRTRETVIKIKNVLQEKVVAVKVLNLHKIIVGEIWPCHLLKWKILRMAISVGKFTFVFSYNDQSN